MRNFFLFVKRFFNLLLFLGVELLCVLLISRTKTLQGNDIVNSSNLITGFVYKQQNDLTYYFNLRQMNDSLQNENLRLRDALSKKYDTKDYFQDSNAVTTIIPNIKDSNHKVTYANYVYRMAQVINNSVTEKNNYITLNRGSAEGVFPGMAVISGSGIVGKVIHVSSHFASVISILSDLQPVSAQLREGTFGIVRWAPMSSAETLFMNDVPPEIEVKIKDSVFTTNYSIFPPHLLVGAIVKIDKDKKNNKYLLTIKPATNFRKLQYVYVVENTMLPERLQLEATNKAVKELQSAKTKKHK